MSADWGCPDGELVLTVEQAKDRPLWLAERRKGIGGSDVAKLMGDSRYGTEFDLWLDKTGREPDREPSLPMEMGARFEAAVAEKFAEDRGLEIRRRGMLRSKIEPVLLFNADRLSSDGGVVEVKVVNGFMKMPPEDDGTDPYCGWPKGWFWQGVGGLFTTGRKLIHLVVAIGNHDFVVRTMHRDDERVGAAMTRLVEYAPAWWQKHVVEGEMPEMSVPGFETDPDRPLEGGKWEAFIPEQLLEWRDRLKELRDAKKDIDAEEKALKAKIEAESGGARWLLADGRPVLQFNPRAGRATFQKKRFFAEKPLNGRQIFEWLEKQDVVDNLEGQLDRFEMLESEYTTSGAPSRSLLIVGDADTKEE